MTKAAKRVIIVVFCMFFLFHRHSWSKWGESCLNHYVGHHCKTIVRYCDECGESESRVMALDCTRHRKIGKWCDYCATIIELNPSLAILVALVYPTDMSKKIPGPKTTLGCWEVDVCPLLKAQL
jgi:hypothetical protein